MATVTKRKWTYKGVEKSAWVVRYVDGRGNRKQETFEQKKLADKFRLKVETELHQGVHVAASDTVTLRVAADLYLDDCERRLKIKDRMTRTTLANYRAGVKYTIAPTLGGVKLTDVTADMLQEHLNNLAITYSRANVARARWLLKAILALAVRKRLIARNIVVEGGVRVPCFERERVAVPSRAELGRLLAEVEKREKGDRHNVFEQRRCAIVLAIFCGMRRGEICGLHWENVDFEARMIRVRHNMSFLDGLKSPKTWAGIRDIAMPERVMLALRALHDLRGNPEDGLAFLTHKAKRVTPVMLWEYWRTVAERAGLCDETGRPKYHFHALRHANVSLLIADGLTPLHIKSHIGHANVSTTLNVYGHLFPEDESIRKSVDRITAGFSVAQENAKSA